MIRWYATGTDIDDRVRAEERTPNESLALREQIDRDSMFEDIVGSSESLSKVLGQVNKVAASDSSVLVLGETGTGNELVARARTFSVPVECRAYSDAAIARTGI